LDLTVVYLDDLAAKIRALVPEGQLPDADSEELFRLYAVLLRAKGATVTQSDVHDAWSAWMAKRDEKHESLVPFEDLPEAVREEDRVFTAAIRKVADELGLTEASRPSFFEVLFPAGPPAGEAEMRQAFDLYKVMVDSSESLVNRRQAVNTFFLTINGALLTASGIIVQSSGDSRLGAVGVAVFAVAGVILCAAWRSLITSFGQLNRGKFEVINAIERYLRAGIYAAEWEALGRGKDPKIYRSFTSREIWVPTLLLGLHVLTAVGAVLFVGGMMEAVGGKS
jgi:hypothetical protein